MTKLFLITALAVCSIHFAQAQKDSVVKPAHIKKDWSKVDLSSRTNDHLVIQFGSDSWANRPDSIRTSGFSRHFNAYFMIDKPMKLTPRMSVAFGVGIGSSNVFLKNTLVDITGALNLNKMTFKNVDSTTHYKKYKVATVFAEVPVELRFMSNPANPAKSWHLALGVKVGTLLDAHTKGKEPVDKNGNVLPGQGKVVEKEKSKRFINGTRIATTFRAGYGHFSVYTAYQINGIIKDTYGPQINPFSLGICLSGL
jgi:hypothetical protein